MSDKELPDDEFLQSSSFFIRNAVNFISNKILNSVNLRNVGLYRSTLFGFHLIR
jgi:hypothetical protein